MVVDDGLFAVTRSHELLSVIRQYGDAAMDFIWKNKDSLVIATALGTFLEDPQVILSGAKDLAETIARSIN